MRVGAKEPILMSAFLRLAQEIAEATTCRRAAVGCVLTDPELTKVVGIGYNGVPSGYPNDGCEGTDQPGSCRHTCVHAELNAVIKAPTGPKFAFISCPPCRQCAQALVQSQVQAVVYTEGHRPVSDGVELLNDYGIPHGSVDEVWAELTADVDQEDDFTTRDGWMAAKARRSAFADR